MPDAPVVCRFAVGEGDLVTGLNAWHAWQESGRSGKWAHNHFLNHRTLLRAADIRAQLTHHLRSPSVLIAHSIINVGLCSYRAGISVQSQQYCA